MDAHSAQVVSWVASAVLNALSTVALLVAAVRFRRGLARRSAEALMALETAFRELAGIRRLVDTEAKQLVSSGLKRAVVLSLLERQEDRDDDENGLMKGLDELLGFLVQLVVLWQNGLITTAALWDRYHYWLRCVFDEPVLRAYAARYFPTLFRFLDRTRGLRRSYERRHERTRREFGVLLAELDLDPHKLPPKKMPPHRLLGA